jgi:hypothetical protein
MPEYLRQAHKIGQARYIKTGKKHLRGNTSKFPVFTATVMNFLWSFPSENTKIITNTFFIGIARDIPSANKRSASSGIGTENFPLWRKQCRNGLDG